MRIYVILATLTVSVLQAQTWQWEDKVVATTMSDHPEQVRSMLTDHEGNVYILAPVGVTNLEVDGHPKTGYSGIGDGGFQSDYMLASFTCDGVYRW